MQPTLFESGPAPQAPATPTPALFIEAVRAQVEQFEDGTPDRLILEYLLRYAVGRHNAKTWAQIDDYLRAHGHAVSKNVFQTGLLNRSRQGTMWIGSCDHLPHRGYFIIADKEDAELMAEFYHRRIESEQERISRLLELIGQRWPQTPAPERAEGAAEVAQ